MRQRPMDVMDTPVRPDFKKPWSDGTTSLDLDPLALIARLAWLVPPPKRHTVRYFGVLSSHAASRTEVVPAPVEPTPPSGDKPKNTSRYISWSELLRRTFGFELLCSKCKGPLRMVALIKSEEVARKILTAMHLPTEVPELHPARPPPGTAGMAGGQEETGEDWLS